MRRRFSQVIDLQVSVQNSLIQDPGLLPLTYVAYLPDGLSGIYLPTWIFAIVVLKGKLAMLRIARFILSTDAFYLVLHSVKYIVSGPTNIPRSRLPSLDHWL